MAHHRPKSVRSREAEQQKEFKVVDAERSAGSDVQRKNHEELSQANLKQGDTTMSSKSLDEQEGGTWQFKFAMGVIALAVLMLILKTIGLF
jgi:hypothetical protein